MRPLSPIDALGPAFTRTREVFGSPFRLGFFLKIALVAALTQPSFLSSIISYPVQAANFAAVSKIPHVHRFALSPTAASVGLIVVLLGAVGIVVWLLIAYLYCRLRFTLFDIVVYRRRLVGEAWRPYGRQTWRYLGLFLLSALAFLLLAAIVVGPPAIHFVHMVRRLNMSNPDPFAVLAGMLPLFLSVLLIFLLWSVVDAVMQDFLLPPMAVEDAPIEGALARLGTVVRTGFGSFLVYLLMRFAVSLALSSILMIVVMMVLLFLGLGLGATGFVLYHALWHAGTAGQVVFIAVAAVAALLVIALYAGALISVYGVSAVFKQAYAAFYFGGRYPELGNLLDPMPPAGVAPAAAYEPAPPPSTAPPMPPSAPPATEPPALW